MIGTTIKKPMRLKFLRWEGTKESESLANELNELSLSIEFDDSDKSLTIGSKTGSQKVSVGDYIIQGFDGEIYPCPKEVFESTYAVFNLPRKIEESHIQDILSNVEYRQTSIKDTKSTICMSFFYGMHLSTATATCNDGSEFDENEGLELSRDLCESLTRDKLWELEQWRLHCEIKGIMNGKRN